MDELSEFEVALLGEERPCIACRLARHDECVEGCETCHPEAEEAEEATGEEFVSVGEAYSKSVENRKHGSTAKELKDPKSTGRKRAAQLYPLDKEEDCEWRGKKNCGGGRRPIIGCYDGKQKHRHHGPMKDPTKNHEGNVHRICTACHMHWHELNDLIYDEKDYAKLPHDPLDATVEEIIQNRLDWLSGEVGKKYELASTKNTEKFNQRMQKVDDDE